MIAYPAIRRMDAGGGLNLGSSMGWLNAVAVLISRVHARLGLATPISILVGTGRGAEVGVLLRNAEALELLERIDTVVIDKTGTLTQGRPRLTAFMPVPGVVRAAARGDRGRPQRSRRPPDAR